MREAALTLFAERGYHGATMAQIAERLGIRTPSLYNHVRSKEELLREICVQNTAAVLRDFDAAVAGVDDPVERLRRAMYAYVMRHITHPREAFVVNRDVSNVSEPARSEVLAKRKQHDRAVRGLIEQGRAAGRFHVAHPALASFAVLEMCVSVARWFRADGPLSPDEVAWQYSEFAVQVVGVTCPDGEAAWHQ